MTRKTLETSGAIYQHYAVKMASLMDTYRGRGDLLKEPITGAQMRVLSRLARGQNLSKIAESLGVSIGTVRAHKAEVRLRLGGLSTWATIVAYWATKNLYLCINNPGSSSHPWKVLFSYLVAEVPIAGIATDMGLTGSSVRGYIQRARAELVDGGDVNALRVFWLGEINNAVFYNPNYKE